MLGPERDLALASNHPQSRAVPPPERDPLVCCNRPEDDRACDRGFFFKQEDAQEELEEAQPKNQADEKTQDRQP